MIARPRGTGHREKISLDPAATHVLEECRMVLPGIQALFGFQLIAVFNDSFAEKLSPLEQRLHLAAIVLIVVAIALVMAPAAVHRATSQREVSERFVWLASKLLLGSMLPLALGLCIDVYLVASVVLGSGATGAAIAGVLFLALLGLWVALPRRERRLHR